MLILLHAHRKSKFCSISKLTNKVENLFINSISYDLDYYVSIKIERPIENECVDHFIIMRRHFLELNSIFK